MPKDDESRLQRARNPMPPLVRAVREPAREQRLAQMLDELRLGDLYMKMAWGPFIR